MSKHISGVLVIGIMDLCDLEEGNCLPWEDPSESTELCLTREEIMKWKAVDMKKWLEKRKKPRSGNKSVLCSRILRHLAGFLSDEDSDSDNEDADDVSDDEVWLNPKNHIL